MTRTYGDKESTTTLKSILMVAAFIVLAVPYGALWNALGGWQLWQWFLIPLGAPDISGWHIAGLMLLIAFARYKVGEPSNNRDSMKVTMIKTIITPPAITVLYLAIGLMIAKFAGLA